MAFDITSVLGKAAARPLASDRQIEMIELHLIDKNPRNYYSVEGIDALADNIRTVGLLEPLIVKRDEHDRYMLISGHRRRAALCRLADEGFFPDGMHHPIPCIVQDFSAPLPGIEPGSEAEAKARQHLEELTLLLANSDTREKNSADKAVEVRRIREIFTAMQVDGYQFPGKLRAHVAAAAGVSQSRIARLDVIEKRLKDPELRKAWKSGELKETSAYEIARFSDDVQKYAREILGTDVLCHQSTEAVRELMQDAKDKVEESQKASAQIQSDLQKFEEASGNFGPEEYLKQMHEEDTILRELCRKNIGSILRELMFFKDDYNFDENFRQANIDRIRKNDPHSSYTVGWNANDGTGTSIDWSSKGIEVRYGRRPKFRKTWVDFYDALCGAALQAAWMQPVKVSAQDTGTKWSTGAPTEAGEYLAKLGVGSEETDQTSFWRVIMWDGNSWRQCRSNAAVREKVYRWLQLPEE